MKRVVLIVAALALHMGGVGQASADYMQTVLADNPAGYWRLGEASGTTASDSSGNGHNGTYMGGVTLGQPGAIAGDPNTSVAFNGTNGIVDTSFVPNVLSFTIEAWVNPATASARPQTVAGVSGAAQLQYDYIFAGHPDIEFWDGASFRRAWTTSALPLNIWSDVVGTWDNSTKELSIYVNGVLNNTVVYAAATSALGDPAGTFQIGAFNDTLHGGSFNSQYFQGRIDEVAYYDYALSAAQIQAHYQAAVVPEPASLTLLGIGALSMAGCTWRRRKQAA